MKIVFMGTPQAAVPSLERLVAEGHNVAAVYTQPDRPAGRGNKIIFSPVKEFALARNIEILQPFKVKTPDALETFRSHKADVAVVVAYGRILPEGFLNAFPGGAINLHFSLLPKYRGAAPVNWAIVNGETISGVTTIKMDAGLDTGDILLKREIEICPEENSVELMGRLSVVGADLLAETLGKYKELNGLPQNHDEASFAPIMKREDGLINWKMSAGEIVNRIRGFQPFPGSFTTFRGQKLGLWKAYDVSPVGFYESIDGEIIESKGDSLIVSCGSKTFLRIVELQPEGKRRMAVRDFINGMQPIAGEYLGN